MLLLPAEVWSLEGRCSDFGNIPRTPRPWGLFLGEMQEGPSGLAVICIFGSRCVVGMKSGSVPTSFLCSLARDHHGPVGLVPQRGSLTQLLLAWGSGLCLSSLLGGLLLFPCCRRRMPGAETVKVSPGDRRPVCLGFGDTGVMV